MELLGFILPAGLRLLDRSQIEDDEVSPDEEDTDLLKAFKVLALLVT